MHCFYFVIQRDPRYPKRQAERVSNICQAASRSGVSCYTETHDDTVTIQAEVSSDEDAAVFKLAAEPALSYAFRSAGAA